MQAQGSLIQGGMMGNFINIYQQEGTRGLWKVPEDLQERVALVPLALLHFLRSLSFSLRQGVSLTAQRAAIVVGVELPAYDVTKKHLILSGYMGDTVYTHFL